MAKAIADRDAAFAVKYGLPERHDVWNLRQAMSQPGWDKTLARWLQLGTIPLPGIAAAPVAYDALSDG